jgi:hypothetical protein
MSILALSLIVDRPYALNNLGFSLDTILEIRTRGFSMSSVTWKTHTHAHTHIFLIFFHIFYIYIYIF